MEEARGSSGGAGGGGRPAGRVSFFDQQVRHRRAARRWSALWGAGVVLIGAPLSALLTPLVFLVVVLAVRAADLVLPVPEAAYAALRAVVRIGPEALALLDLDRLTPAIVIARLPGLAALLLPGLGAALLLWLALRTVLRRDGAGGLLEALGARESRPDDPEERQLVNLVEEMAIAAGAPAPRVLLLDRADPNAAAVGSSPADAVLIVHRGVLDRLDRDRTQALIGHLVAAVAAGDLGLSLSALAVDRTIGLLLTAGDALFTWSPSAWRDLGRVVRWALPGGRDEPAHALAELLERDLMSIRDDGLFPVGEEKPTRWRRALDRWPFLHVILLPFLPLFLLLFFVRAEIHFLRFLLVDPLVTLVLRARCHLADAGAVRLTRYPDALAGALERLRGEATAPPGGGRLDHLFVIGPEREAGSGSAGAGGAERSRLIAPHPPVRKRLRRLAAMGAAADRGEAPAAAAGRRAGRRLRGGPVAWLAMLVLVPLLLLAGYLLAVLVAFFFLAAAALALLVALGGLALVGKLLP